MSNVPPIPNQRGARPVLGSTPRTSTRIPKPPRPKANQLWSFSFRFFRQERYFAFEGLGASWFASLFERLQSMSMLNVEKVLTDPKLKNDLRCHDVRWGEQYSHFTRSYFDWIAPEYLHAEDDYPLCQFQVSTGLGRVVGFFDENHTFQVVALDPKHNLQKSSGREARKDCQIIRSDIMEMKARMDRALKALEDDVLPSVERARKILADAVTHGNVAFDRHWIVVELERTDADALHGHLVSGPGRTIRDVIERALLLLEEEAITSPT